MRWSFALLLSSNLALAEPSEALKIEALKLGYALNSNSMVRWGSIDLVDIMARSKPQAKVEKKK